MHILNVDFQLVTENIASNLDEKTRILENVAPSWNFVVIFSVILGLVLVKQFAAGRMGLVLSMLYQNPDTEKVTRGWNPFTSMTSLLITASYIALTALLIQRAMLVFNGNTTLYGGSDFYLEACIFTSAYIIVQYLLINMAGWLFDTRPASLHHSMTHLSMAMSMNFALVLLLLIMSFYPTKFFAVIGLIIFLIFNTIRLIKTFVDLHFLIKGETSKIFLYLCTLEILPFSVALTMVFRLIATDSVL
ncbi:MAG: DUF4271 domain-containing protein [Bacteroidales bacterium]|nr:DUF4271 domain-containing protein [Bacteroidales bacterium]